MNPQITLLNMIRAALLVAIAIYMFIGEKLGPSRAQASPILFQAIAVVSIMTIVAIFLLRRSMVLPALDRLQSQSQDSQALLRWRAGYIATYALCEALALYGFVLRVLGFPFAQVIPFYVASAGLMLYYRPQLPQSEPMASKSSG
ncbi:MAG TPA: hypothetical protein VEV41_18800 [Terriglobales bacterium]|nr:hypothetical protein [Terriglobales bacterium]